MGDVRKSKIAISTAALDHEKSRTSRMSATMMSSVPGKFTSRLRMRRSSFGYGGVQGIGKVMDRVSVLAPEFKRPVMMYLPTYQLEPLVPFHVASVTKAVNQILDDVFTDHKYNPQESPLMALRVASDLMKAVKAMAFNRYRVITVATIAQRRAQSYNNAISFLWDYQRDNYVNVNRDTPTAFIQVTVFGIYLD